MTSRNTFQEAFSFLEGRAWGWRVLALAGLILLLAGCSLPQINLPPAVDRLLGREEAAVVSDETAAATASNLHLLAPQGTTGENVLLLDLVNRYNRSLTINPEATANLTVTVELAPRYAQALSNRLAEDPPPDVVAVDSFSFAGLADAGKLAPIPSTVMVAQDLHPKVRAAFEVDGQLMCARVEASTLALVYNKAVFDALAQPYPQADWTWDDLQAAAKALTVVDSGYYGLVASPDFSRWLAFLRQAGGDVLEADGQVSLETEAGSAALGFFVGLFQNGYAHTPLEFGAAWSGEAFAGDHIAMTIEGNWLIPYLRDAAPGLDFGVVDLPGGPPPTGTEATVAFANCYAIPADSPHPAEAAALIAYLTSPEAMTAWADLRLTIPARTDLQSGWLGRHPLMAPFLTGLDRATLWQFPPSFQTVLDNFQVDLQDVLAGSMLSDVLLNRADAFGAE